MNGLEFPEQILHPSSDVHWVDELAKLARCKGLQPAILITSILFIAASFLKLWRYPTHYLVRPKPPGLTWLELFVQSFRVITFILITVTAHRANHHLLNAVTLGYVFALGLVRTLVSHAGRHILLHHMNIVSLTTLLILLADEILALLVIGSKHKLDTLVALSVGLLACSVLLAFQTPREWVPPTTDDPCPDYVEPEPSNEETCSWMDYYLTFSRANDLIAKGWKRSIGMNDLPGLAWMYSPQVLHNDIVGIRKRYKTTLKTIPMLVPFEIVTSAICANLFFAAQLSSPFGLYKLLDYFSNPEKATLHPYIWLLVIFVGEVFQSFTVQQLSFSGNRAAIKLKSALTTEVYQLVLSSKELETGFLDNPAVDTETASSRNAAGQLANLMSSDVKTVSNGPIEASIAFGIPIGVVAAFIGLYKVAGWPCLVGIAISLLGSPLPAWIVRNVGKEQEATKEAQDSRISIASEYLGAITVVKYFGWEDTVKKLIGDARAKEQRHLWRVDLLVSLMDEIGDFIPHLALLVTYALYVGVQKRPLTAPVAFTTISLLQAVSGNLLMLGQVLAGMPRILISCRRLDRFFAATTPLERYPIGPLALQKATFRRNKTAEFRLRHISVSFVEGGLNVVTGPSGCGKTTLLLAILGETIREAGTVSRPVDVTYASQTPWLQAKTIKDNIIFYNDFDAQRYDAVVEACCLEEDLQELRDGDLTDVQDNGMALSGGQRARVALARALYSKASVLLLDNIFSAIDTRTSVLLWNRVFCTDMLRSRTVVLVAQMPWIEAAADLTIKMQAGEVASVEQNIGIIRMPRVVRSEDEVECSGTATAIESSVSSDTGNQHPGKITSLQSEVDQEVEASGSSGRLLFLNYMAYFGSPIVVILTVSTLVILNGFEMATTLWMSHWVDTYAKDNTIDTTFFLGIYIAISVCTTLVHGTAFLTFMRGGWVAAKKLHSQLVSSVLAVSLSWFKTNPIGRVVNRLSGDMDTLDQSLAESVKGFLYAILRVILQTGAVSSLLPLFAAPTTIGAILSLYFGEAYHRTATVITKLLSSSQSPIFTLVSESFTGLAVIRAQSRTPDEFGKKLDKLLSDSAQATAAQRECSMWLKCRINSLAAIIDGSAGFLALTVYRGMPAGLVGFSLVTASRVSNAILQIVYETNILNNDMQSFHRIQEFCELPPEEVAEKTLEATYVDHPTQNVPLNWPQSGRIEFRHVTIRYDEDGPDILKDVSLIFDAGERIAIVGRTGSGKSTLILSLLRFTHIVSGTILYDGVDISVVPRQRLRHAITTIPQEALLFQGTVESNLDPTGAIDRRRLLQALESCASITAMQSAAQASPDDDTEDSSQTTGNLSLSTVVHSGGSNFSHGQRQVLSLCRALVRGSKLMLLDEATSHMDADSDMGIQKVLRAELDATNSQGRCLITIAHRLSTIADYDKIVVMGSGRVLEVGSPQVLMARTGAFYDMVMHSEDKGMFDGLA